MTKEEQLKKLDIEITYLESQRAALVQEIRADEYAVKVGDIASYNGKQYQIWRFDVCWPIGKLIKRDGSVSSCATHLYNFPKKGESK